MQAGQRVRRRTPNSSAAPVRANSASRSAFTSKKSTGDAPSAPHCSGRRAPTAMPARRSVLDAASPRTAHRARTAARDPAGGADFPSAALMRPGHSDARMTDISAEMAFAEHRRRRAGEQFGLQRGIDERVGDRFLVAARREDLERLRFDRRLFGKRANVLRARSRRFRRWLRSRRCAPALRSGRPRSRCRNGAAAASRASRHRRRRTRMPSDSSVGLTSSSAIVVPSSRAMRVAAQLHLGAARQLVFDLDDVDRARLCRPRSRAAAAVARSTARSWWAGSTPRSNR